MSPVGRPVVTPLHRWYLWLILALVALALADAGFLAALFADLPSPDDVLTRSAAPSTFI